MESFLSGLNFVVSPLLRPIARLFKRDWARRREGFDGRDPTSIDPEIDEALEVLSGSAKSMSAELWSKLKGKATRSAIFDKAIPQQWIGTEKAQELIRASIHAMIAHKSIDPYRHEAVSFYCSFRDNLQ